MSDTIAKRRYFVVEGEEANELRDKCLRLQKEHRDKLQALRDRYRAEAVMTRNGYPVALLVNKGYAPPPGCKVDGKHVRGGTTYLEYKPLLNRKAGIQLQAEFKAIGGFSGSDIILRHYKAERHAIEGNKLLVSTAGIMKEMVIVQVPVNDQEPFDPPPSFREIKRSEWVAITEE